MTLCNSENILVAINISFSTKTEHSSKTATLLQTKPAQQHFAISIVLNITVLQLSYHYLKINIFVSVEEE